MKLTLSKSLAAVLLSTVALIAGGLVWKTNADLLALPTFLSTDGFFVRKVQVTDRNYQPLTVTYQNRWNLHDHIPLHDIPQFLQQAFVVSEDQRFYRHKGVDWAARLHAIYQNIKVLDSIRGASTISEQVIRMWYPRPRTLWSRWLEGIEAGRLEKEFSKNEIFEFYLNQVPYAGRRRGVVQAARLFFDRDPDTLSTAEMLALVVMVRAPSRLDVRRNPDRLFKSIEQLADRLLEFGVLDQRHEILAWVNSGACLDEVSPSWIDAVTTPRQPGSTLKPFLYALALEKGWTAATLVDDSPLSESVGRGLHAYQNYSRIHYGMLRVRQALGNSLNIPALRAAQFVGVDALLACLQELGVQSLQQHPDYYGDGLALGNGEITLLELVQAYTVLARQGIYRPLKYLLADVSRREETRRVFSAETASLIGNILSDPTARRLEFGNGSLLRFPIQTAVKTGTFSDYRDAWALGFNHRFTVGVWIGNLDHLATDGITGANGATLVLRSVLAELNRHQNSRPLYLSPRLVKTEICRQTGLQADGHCASLSEWFVPGTEPKTIAAPTKELKPVYLRYPTQGMQLAMDPRMPDDQEAFVFRLANLPQRTPVDWYVDDWPVATSTNGEYLWRLQRGIHSVRARIWWDGSRQFQDTPDVSFTVK
ncbi:MAG: transglycosylase domain-containing protein [Desulfobacteraceae bacterium]|jgi:membrane carboxypeptidase/penicillin-binding protein PbpC|nr:transglycosylase domain-containing protein [Desulfobacteraceae bacterium]